MKKFSKVFYQFIIFMLFTFNASIVHCKEESDSIKDVATVHIDTAKNLFNMITEFIVKYSFQAIGGVIVLALGWMISKYVDKLLANFLRKQKVDVTISKFLIGGVKLSIMIFAFIVALGKFGIEIAPLIAGISVVGFGTSFALQGPLSNYASGATLIFTKPFKVGEIIEVAGVIGEVLDIKLPRTEMKTIDGNTIVVPNKHIVGEVIQNYSKYKRLDIKIGISYKADVQKAIDILKDVINKDDRVVKDNRKNIGILEFADSSVNLIARLKCKQDVYWEVMFDINKLIYQEFNKNDIEIPFPQRDVHIYQENNK